MFSHTFYPNFSIFYTNISAVSVTFHKSEETQIEIRMGRGGVICCKQLDFSKNIDLLWLEAAE